MKKKMKKNLSCNQIRIVSGVYPRLPKSPELRLQINTFGYQLDSWSSSFIKVSDFFIEAQFGFTSVSLTWNIRKDWEIINWTFIILVELSENGLVSISDFGWSHALKVLDEMSMRTVPPKYATEIEADPHQLFHRVPNHCTSRGNTPKLTLKLFRIMVLLERRSI